MFSAKCKENDTAMFIITSPENDVYHKINDVTNVPVYARFKQDFIKVSCTQLCQCYLNIHLKFGDILSKTYKDMTLYLHMYQNVHCNLSKKNFSIQECPLYRVCNSRNIVSVSLCLVPV